MGEGRREEEEEEGGGGGGGPRRQLPAAHCPQPRGDRRGRGGPVPPRGAAQRPSCPFATLRLAPGAVAQRSIAAQWTAVVAVAPCAAGRSVPRVTARRDCAVPMGNWGLPAAAAASRCHAAPAPAPAPASQRRRGAARGCAGLRRLEPE